MKIGELMRSERTSAEFDILVAFLGSVRTRFSILRYGHFKGTGSNSDRLLYRSSSSIPAEAGLGRVKVGSGLAHWAMQMTLGETFDVGFYGNLRRLEMWKSLMSASGQKRTSGSQMRCVCFSLKTGHAERRQPCQLRLIAEAQRSGIAAQPAVTKKA